MYPSVLQQMSFIAGCLQLCGNPRCVFFPISQWKTGNVIVPGLLFEICHSTHHVLRIYVMSGQLQLWFSNLTEVFGVEVALCAVIPFLWKLN